MTSTIKILEDMVLNIVTEAETTAAANYIGANRPTAAGTAGHRFGIFRY